MPVVWSVSALRVRWICRAVVSGFSVHSISPVLSVDRLVWHRNVGTVLHQRDEFLMSSPVKRWLWKLWHGVVIVVGTGLAALSAIFLLSFLAVTDYEARTDWE